MDVTQRSDGGEQDPHGWSLRQVTVACSAQCHGTRLLSLQRSLDRAIVA
jgi:hypothetical protein